MVVTNNIPTIVCSPTERFAICEGTNEQKEFQGQFCKFLMADFNIGKKYEIKLSNDFEWISYPENVYTGSFSHRVNYFYWLSDKYLVVSYVNRAYIEDEVHILYKINAKKRKEIKPISKERIVRVDSEMAGCSQTLGPNYLAMDEIEFPNFVIPRRKPIILKRMWNFLQRLLNRK